MAKEKDHIARKLEEKAKELASLAKKPKFYKCVPFCGDSCFVLFVLQFPAKWIFAVLLNHNLVVPSTHTHSMCATSKECYNLNSVSKANCIQKCIAAAKEFASLKSFVLTTGFLGAVKCRLLVFFWCCV